MRKPGAFRTVDQMKLKIRKHEGRRHFPIEYGPGTGSFVIAAAEHGARIFAVDISSSMVDYARRQL
jgi:ubiquinone/menaquinone biosynthesis C-methylase UbiE